MGKSYNVTFPNNKLPEIGDASLSVSGWRQTMKVELRITEETAAAIRANMEAEADVYYSQPHGWNSAGGLYGPLRDPEDVFSVNHLMVVQTSRPFAVPLEKVHELDGTQAAWRTSADNTMYVGYDAVCFDARRHAVRELLRFFPEDGDIKGLKVLWMESKSNAPW